MCSPILGKRPSGAIKPGASVPSAAGPIGLTWHRPRAGQAIGQTAVREENRDHGQGGAKTGLLEETASVHSALPMINVSILAD